MKSGALVSPPNIYPPCSALSCSEFFKQSKNSLLKHLSYKYIKLIVFPDSTNADMSFIWFSCKSLEKKNTKARRNSYEYTSYSVQVHFYTSYEFWVGMWHPSLDFSPSLWHCESFQSSLIDNHQNSRAALSCILNP